MVTINPADCPKTCTLWFHQQDDGTMSLSLDPDVIADDGRRYVLVADIMPTTSLWDRCMTTINKAGWEAEHVATLRYSHTQLWELRNTNAAKDNARECGRRDGDALPVDGCGSVGQCGTRWTGTRNL